MNGPGGTTGALAVWAVLVAAGSVAEPAAARADVPAPVSPTTAVAGERAAESPPDWKDVVAVNVATPGRLLPRETALVGVERFSVGVFNPLTLRLSERMELRSHPLLFLVAPNAILRVGYVRNPTGWSMAAEYGLSIPTVAMRLSQGYLFPSWKRGGGTIGWTVAPRAGAVVTRGFSTPTAVTASIDLTVGVPISRSDAMPLDAPAPLNLLMAPVLTGARAHAGVLIDRALTDALRLRGYGDAYVIGRSSLRSAVQGLGWSNLVTRVGLGLDFSPGRRRLNRLTLGFAWWNSDQHEIDETTFERVRTNEFWPTVDFVWAG
jgi:hypothetical protein